MPLFNQSHLPLIIFSAYILDLIIGDPKWLPHPVRWIGIYIAFLENRIRQIARTPLTEKVGGLFLFFIIVGTVFGLSWLFLYFTYHLSPIAYSLFSVFIAYTTLSIKSLRQEASSVIHALENISIDEARKKLSMIVGRDTQNLSEEEIYRAVVETVSENTSDGIIAPLFYLAIGGAPLALAYKAVNTLDSMVGYKNETYKNLGWFSAKMDDIFNFIPARLTAILMVIASFLLRLDWENSLKIVWRDSRNHASPNAGWPEAAVAGALNCQLGGDNYYFGELVRKPLIGDKISILDKYMVKKTIRIMHLAAILFVVGYWGYGLLWFSCKGKVSALLNFY